MAMQAKDYKSSPRLGQWWSCRQEQDGFTIIEAILSIAVLAVGMFGVMSVMENTVANSLDNSSSLRALQLSRERIEEIFYNKETNGWVSVDNSQYPNETLNGNDLGFSRTTNIVEVNATDLITPEANSGYRKITITVAWGSKQVQLESLITDWVKP